MQTKEKPKLRLVKTDVKRIEKQRCRGAKCNNSCILANKIMGVLDGQSLIDGLNAFEEVAIWLHETSLRHKTLSCADTALRRFRNKILTALKNKGWQ